MSRTVTVLGTLLLLAVVVGYAFWHLVNKSVSSDLSVIGQGRPVAVLVYENYSPTSMEHLDVIHAAREDLDDRIVFRVAGIGSPEGDRFIARYDAPRGALLVLDGDGELLAGISMPGEAGELKEQLNSIFED